MSKTVWGMSGLSHDAAITVVRGDKVLFASSSERYSRVKNDKNFNNDLLVDCLHYGGAPEEIIWYENPYFKSLRSLIFDKHIVSPFIRNKLKNLSHYKFKYCGHHQSHLNASLYTAPFDIKNSLGVVVDTVGEFSTLTIWNIKDYNKKKIIYRQYYPNSLGLFYSSITKLLDLKPQEEEYIVMGMASYGKTDKYYHLFKNYFFHEGSLVKDLRTGCGRLLSYKEIQENKFDIALGAQLVFEEILINLIKKYLNQTRYHKIILSGGCALNCTCNSKILQLVDNMWVFPNPGDAGSSLGAALEITKTPIDLKHVFLGHDSQCSPDVEAVVNCLDSIGIVGVVNGRSEFGPRALGNRSILADPRILDIKDRVNQIKGRELFRPFAPAVLESHFNNIFYNKNTSTYFPFMQYTFQSKNHTLYPGAVHVDGTSRVQTVNENTPFIFNVLKKWYEKTGCPLLLNTSLNKKGKPLVNNKKDLEEFESIFKVLT